MWRPGQLITISGIVYRVKKWNTPQACKDCAFDNDPNCDLKVYEPKYRSCTSLIPFNCHFERVSPIIKIVR